MARSGQTNDSLFGNIALAKQINLTLGGPFIAPWEVDELPNTFIDVILATGTDLSQMRSELQKIENRFAEWRSEHPTYKK